MKGHPIKVLLITGYSRSGSTLLARMLGEMTGFVAIGELRYLWQRGLVENRRCDCGKPCRSCAFWQEATDRALGGMDFVNTREVLAEQAHIDRLYQIPMLALQARRNVVDEKVASHLSRYERLFGTIGDMTEARVIVDSSKDPSYGHVLALSDAIDLSVIHLVRDSRAVAYSWTRHKHDPGTGREMARQLPLRSALEWAAANLGAAWLTNRVEPTLRLRYEDLVQRPGLVVRQILELLGEEGDLTMVGNLIDMRPSHAVSGNPMRFQRGSVRVTEDGAWRSGLSAWNRRLVTGLTWPGMLSYGYFARQP